MKLKLKSFFLIFFLTIGLFSFHYAQAGLTLTDTGTGTNRVVTIESSGQFRLAFEASMNYGLSKWYDLVNDPGATKDILQNPTDYIPAAEQGSVFNQLFNPGDPGTVGILDHNNPKFLAITENTASRIIIDTNYHPRIDNPQVELFTTYYIYPDGKIYIKNKLHSLSTYTLDGTSSNGPSWAPVILGLGDPSFLTRSTGGTGTGTNSTPKTITDVSKNWVPNEWAGYRVTQGGFGYQAFEVVSNTSNTLTLGAWNGAGNNTVYDGAYGVSSRGDKFGWMRATNTQNPYGWSNTAAKYLYEYWDPTTPAPYTDWTKANIVLIPKTGNPYQGDKALHEWKGFKRWSYYNMSPIPLTAGQDIIHEYLVQLGTEGSSVLPNIATTASINTVAENIANAYLANPVPPNPVNDSIAPSAPSGLSVL